MIKTVDEIASYQAKYSSYLFDLKYTDSSVKSSLKDLDDYFVWYSNHRAIKGFRLSQSNTLPALFTNGALEQYLSYLRENFPMDTMKRKLAALSSFCQYAVENKWLSSKLLSVFQMLADKQHALLDDQQKILAEFKLALQKSQNNPNTIRGYLADITEYLQVSTNL